MLAVVTKDVAVGQAHTRVHFSGIFPKSINKVIPVVRTNNEDFFYNMKHNNRGVAVIFHHENFDLGLPVLKQRNVAQKDCANLEETLQSLGFETTKYRDLTLKELDAVLEELANKDFSDCDCLFITVLTHGEQGVIYAKNSAYSPNILYNRFTPDKCPTLADKPKIYVIQATVQVDFETRYSTCRIPLLCEDFVVACLTIPSHCSWGSTQEGSKFIQALCCQLRKNWRKYDLIHILTLVNEIVYDTDVPNNPSMHCQKLIPCIASTLTRKIRFEPKQLRT